jgi:hypothetical protein
VYSDLATNSVDSLHISTRHSPRRVPARSFPPPFRVTPPLPDRLQPSAWRRCARPNPSPGGPVGARFSVCHANRPCLPLPHYTDKNSILRTSAAAPLGEQLRGEKARSQFGRALRELGIEWIAAHSPQAKGRIERLFETLQDRLVQEMRLAGIDSSAAANHFLEKRFLPAWDQRFPVAPRRARNAHRRLDAEQRLEEILIVRAGRQVAGDPTVSWDGNRWGVPREAVCAGLRGAQVENRTKTGWLAPATLPRPIISGCAIAQRQDPKTKANPNTMYLQNTLRGDHLAKNRTSLLCVATNCHRPRPLFARIGHRKPI